MVLALSIDSWGIMFCKTLISLLLPASTDIYRLQLRFNQVLTGSYMPLSPPMKSLPLRCVSLTPMIMETLGSHGKPPAALDNFRSRLLRSLTVTRICGFLDFIKKMWVTKPKGSLYALLTFEMVGRFSFSSPNTLPNLDTRPTFP